MNGQISTNTVTVTDENFNEEVVQSELPVLIDFWAEWCGPCKALGPTIEALAADYRGKVKVAKLNVDDSPITAERFGVRSIPTLIVFKDGKAQQWATGVRPQGYLAEFIEYYIH